VPHWEINDTGDIIGVCVIVAMVLVAVVVIVLNRKIKLRKGDNSETVEITSKDDNGETVNTKTMTINPHPTGCDDYQVEHLEIMKSLKYAVSELKSVLLGIDAMQKAETEALCVLLGIAEGDKINGQVAAAKSALLTAKGYKQATEDMGSAT
jgi:hypothetical protein